MTKCKILLLVMFLTGAAAAWAQPERKITRLAVVVLPAPGPNIDCQVLHSQVVQAAFRYSATDGPWQLVLLPWCGHQPESQPLVEVSQLIDKGKNLYRYLQLDQARELFEKVEQLLTLKPPANCDRKKIADFYFYWARTLLDSGDEAGARLLLQQIPRFEPGARPDPATMPPSLVASFDIALDELQAQSPASLLLSSEPGQARLVVDCMEQPSGVVQFMGKDGQTIWLAADSAAGLVSLPLKLDQNNRRSLSIFAPPDGTEEQFSQALAALNTEKPTLAGLQSGKSEALDRLAGVVEADILQVVDMRASGQGKIEIALYLPGLGMEGSAHMVTLDASGQLETNQLAQVEMELAAAVTSPTFLAKVFEQRRTPEPIPAAPVTKSPPWYKSWWFWTAASVVLVGVAGGATAGVMLSGDSPSGRVVITVGCPR